MTVNPCVKCGSNNIKHEATGALEIKGYCFQHCWLECSECGNEGPTLEITDLPGITTTYADVILAWNEQNPVTK